MADDQHRQHSDQDVEHSIAQAEREFAAAESVEELARLWHVGQSLHALVQAARPPRELKVREGVLRVRVEQALGLKLAASRLAHGAAGNQHPGKLDRFQRESVQFLLSELGISKKTSWRAQRIALLPEVAPKIIGGAATS